MYSSFNNYGMLITPRNLISRFTLLVLALFNPHITDEVSSTFYLHVSFSTSFSCTWNGVLRSSFSNNELSPLSQL